MIDIGGRFSALSLFGIVPAALIGVDPDKLFDEISKMVDECKHKEAMVPDDRLKSQLISVEYCFDSADRIQLERKEDLIERGLESPDIADALPLTFAENVYIDKETGTPRATQKVITGFDPLYMMKQRMKR